MFMCASMCALHEYMMLPHGMRLPHAQQSGIRAIREFRPLMTSYIAQQGSMEKAMAVSASPKALCREPTQLLHAGEW